MKKVLSLTLVGLAVAALSAPAFAGKFGGSIRGDVGATGSQVPNQVTDRNDWDWDFTGRLFMYTSCSPCATYVAASWQGSNYTVHSVDPTDPAGIADVKNELSKAKLGMGLDLIKTKCFAFTMEFGGNYLHAELNSTIVTSENVQEISTTEGFGLYTAFKGEYKFPSSCFGNCFSIYGKAEIADIIGRQSYSITDLGASPVPTTTTYDSHYNNIVEVDVEAALVYAPCFKCWDNLNMTFALGVRTDSYVNLFVHSTDGANSVQGPTTLYSLARPTVFLEIGIKV